MLFELALLLLLLLNKKKHCGFALLVLLFHLASFGKVLEGGNYLVIPSI